jgi:hypothetical protein
MKAFPELAAALREMLDRMDRSLRAGGYSGAPVLMYLAGGLAVNYYCGTRYTEDVDASFSRRFVLPKDLSVNYRRRDGTEAFIYFDHNYNTTFALIHDAFEERAQEWVGIGNESRLVHLHVFSPLDLAVSKISRFSEQDRADIRALALERFFTMGELRAHALDAMRDFIGDKRPLMTSLDLICRDVAQ